MPRSSLPEDLGAANPYEYLYTWVDASFVHLDVTTRAGLPRRLVVEADVLPGKTKANHRVEVDTVAGTARLEERGALDPIRPPPGWPTWDHTTYTERPKAGLEVLAEAMADLAP